MQALDTSTLAKRGRPAGPAALCTVQEAATALAVPLKTVYRWTKERQHDGRPVLPVVRLGSRLRLRVSDVDKLPERLAMRLPCPAPSSFFMAKRGSRLSGGIATAAAADVEHIKEGCQPANEVPPAAMVSARREKSPLSRAGADLAAEQAGSLGESAPFTRCGDSESPALEP